MEEIFKVKELFIKYKLKPTTTFRKSREAVP